MRAKFICIIWTTTIFGNLNKGSWGLSLFVLFELGIQTLAEVLRSWGLSLFVLFERNIGGAVGSLVLEG